MINISGLASFQHAAYCNINIRGCLTIDADVNHIQSINIMSQKKPATVPAVASCFLIQ